MSVEPTWTATISVHVEEPEVAEWLARALAPEAAREVPRATATIDRPAPGTVRISLEARDTGAARAALNTYLGWVHLTLETVRASREATTGRSRRTEEPASARASGAPPGSGVRAPRSGGRPGA
jgi:tRNA threonylcarbamoyladenosine modification (KEOPS) complex  Pcc1 subunit